MRDRVLVAGQPDAPQAGEALEELCRAYGYPLYAFVRRQGRTPEDAQDLTQGFFAVEKEQGVKGLVLAGGGHAASGGQVFQVSAELGGGTNWGTRVAHPTSEPVADRDP
ncbi:MAG: hypothetical protein KJ072_22640 [Verrucomicrobia bacterium]|nr:hypothetical protein [Verrucomicrobiota bacterium]